MTESSEWGPFAWISSQEIPPRSRAIVPSKTVSAKAISISSQFDKVKVKRKGVHSKCKSSHSKTSKNYKKPYRGQGR